MENLNLKISSSPHVRSKDTTSDIMFDVIIALVPATAFGLYMFGWYSALLVAVCIGACVGFEALYQHCMHKKVTVGDFSAVVTGLLLALNLPPRLPVWMAVLGSGFAILIVKQLFGGLGQNFMNPALGARCFLLLTFTSYMTNFIYDGVSTATPLAVLRSTGQVSLRSMFLGYTAGTIGETSAAALLIGALYLILKKVISPKIPLIYIGTFAICIAIYAAVKDYDVAVFTLAHLCGGGLMLGAWFMATDYVTSPITPVGKALFGVILGLLTFVLRIFGPNAEGVSFAIIISNLLVPLIERATAPKAFGEGADLPEKNKKRKKEQHEEEKADAALDTAVPQQSDGGTEGKATRARFDGKSIWKAVIAIFAITVILGAALGAVYNVTKEPIEDAKQKAKEESYITAYPDAVSVVPAFNAEECEQFNIMLAELGLEDSTIDEICIASDGGKEETGSNIIGFVILVTNSQGYGGDIQMAVGISLGGEIQGISFLSIKETAGLGMKAKDEAFLSQFIGKQVDTFTYTKLGAASDSEIDALSGATITTSAVVDGMNAALHISNTLREYLIGGGA